jgi:hypothetical protein
MSEIKKDYDDTLDRLAQTINKWQQLYESAIDIDSRRTKLIARFIKDLSWIKIIAEVNREDKT